MSLNMESDPTENSSQPTSPPPPPARINWPVFFAAMFGPTIATILVVQTQLKDPPPVVAFFGGGISGIICGVLLGRRLGRTRQARILLSFLFVLVMGSACVIMNCFGCLASGYKLNF